MSEETTELPALDTDTLGTGAAADRSAAKTDLQRIRERHVTGNKQRRTKDIPVPGFEGDVAIRYRVLPFERAREIELAAAQEPEDNSYRETNVMADEMIAACDSVLVRREDMEMRPLEDGSGGLLKLGNPAVTQALGIDWPTTARETVYGLFGAPDSIDREDVQRMISLHFDAYLTWLNRPARQARVGE